MTGTTSTILVVDDDVAIGLVLVGLLTQAGLAARHIPSAEEALAVCASTPVDLVITDLRMPGMDGMTLLRKLKQQRAEVPIIMLTAHGNVSTAVEAMKSGAADFMTKPFDREQVLFTVRKALTAAGKIASEPPQLPSESSLIGRAQPMIECKKLIDRAARTMATALLLGQSGTGKEVAAREIHEQGLRREGPFVAVSCAALPDQLLESELFGYEKGAFTGAACHKPGRVELAEGGTLFLDEIGDVSMTVQVKLLRLLQEKEYQPLGSVRNKKADVRFIAATHRDLESMVEQGEFRQDLFYRLNVIPIWLPTLQQRPDDIPELAHHFCAKLAADNQRPTLQLTEGAMASLRAQPWPGNVRELQNFIERLVVFADEAEISEDNVRRELERNQRPGSPLAGASTAAKDGDSLAAKRSKAERQAVLEALDRVGGNRTKAARLLGISRRTLYNRLAEFGLSDT